MRKFLLMALAGAAVTLAAPQFAAAMPAGLGGGISTAADSTSSIEQVWHRRWHRHHRHWRHHHRHWRR